MTETTVKSVSPFWYGTLSALVSAEAGVSGMMSREIKGVMTDTPIFVSAEALPKVEKMLVEGSVAHFYGRPVEGTFNVIGPDLRKFSLGGEPRPKAEKAPAPVAEAKAEVKPVAEKKPRSEKQLANDKRYGEMVRARNAARKAAAEAQPVAA